MCVRICFVSPALFIFNISYFEKEEKREACQLIIDEELRKQR